MGIKRGIVVSSVVVAGLLAWLWWGQQRPAAQSEPAESALPAASTGTDPAGPAAPPRAAVEEPLASMMATVQGTVFGPAGEPEADVRLELHRVLSVWPDQRTERLGVALTVGDGRFRFSVPRSHELLVVAHKTGLARTEADVSLLDPDLVIRMEHGFQLDGVVEGPRLLPIPDCLVVLEPTAASVERAIHTRTDRQGRFTFTDVRAGSARLTARHPDFRAVSQPVVVGSRARGHLRFGNLRPLTVEGNINAAGGRNEPLAGVVVRGYPNAWNGRLFLPVEATSDAAGRFVLPGMDSGNLLLEFAHPDLSTRSRLVTVGQESLTLTVEMSPRCSLRGRLVGEVEIPADTELQVSQLGERPVRLVVGADGRFVLADKVSTGKIEVRLLGEPLCFAQTGSRMMQTDVPDADEAEVELRVAPASTTIGTVTDADGAPLAGVRVLWRRPNDGLLAPPRLLAVTNVEGRYAIRGLPRALVLPGLLSTARFVFECYGYGTTEVPFPGAAPGETVEMEPVRLARPGWIEGRVARNGVGEAGAIVFTGNVMTSMRKAVTGPDGKFILRDLPPGSYRLKVAYSARPVWLSESEFDLSAGGELRDIELALPSDRTINGRVVAPDGTPVSNALIVVRGMRGAAYTGDADGSFQLMLPQEDVELEVFANVAMRDLTVRQIVPVSGVLEPDHVVHVVLPLVPSGSVLGRAVSLSDGRPVAGGIVRIAALEPVPDAVVARQRNVRARWVDMAGGELRLDQFPAGRSRLTLHCEGFRPVSRDIDLQPQGQVQLGDLPLERGAMIRGIAVDGEGQPVAGVRVHLGDELDAVPPRAMAAESFTDAAGGFALHGVSPESATLVLTAQGFAPTVCELVLPGDLLRAEPLQVTLRRGGSIVVAIDTGAHGEGEFHMVVLEKRGALADVRTTDVDGKVRFDNRSLGDYVVRVLGAPGEHPATLETEGETCLLEVATGAGR